MVHTYKLLYEDEKLKIDYFNFIEDHLLVIGEEDYVIPRGVLKELATTPRGSIEQKLDNFNKNILFELNKNQIGVDGLHVAICQAHIEEERRMNLSVNVKIKRV